jgi:hypothetical protein
VDIGRRGERGGWTGCQTYAVGHLMSPELEVLDQLVGGDMLVSVLNRIFPDEEHFIRAATPCSLTARSG